MKKLHLFTGALLSALSVQADSGTINRSILTQRTSFENAQDFANWKRSGHALELSTRHYKDGRQSLKWSINNTQALVLGPQSVPGITKATDLYSGGQPETYEPSFIPESMQGGIKLWVYREKASPSGELVFQVGHNADAAAKNPKYRFAMKQNFTGWRALWVHFEEDAKVANYFGSNKMTAMTIKASEDMQGDDVYFDLMQFLTFISRKRHSDDQFVNNKDKSRVDSYLIHNHWLNLKKFTQADKALTASEIESFKTIEKRMEHLILGDPKLNSPAQDKYKKTLQGKTRYAHKILDKLNLKRQNGVLTGLPLFSSRDEQPANDYGTFQVIGSQSFYPLAVDYRMNPTAEKKKQLIDLFDHYENQGFTAGSSVGSTDHIIRLNFYSAAAFLLRKELEQAGKLEEKQKTLAWHTRFGKLAGWDKSQGENTDLIRGGALPKLSSVLFMANNAEKGARMSAFMDYINWALQDAPGYIDTIKPDHSIFHHRGAYQNSYGIQALSTISIVAWLTRGTDFELPQETLNSFRETLLAQFDFAADFELHPALCGRFPYTNDGLSRMLLPAFAFMSELDGKIIDHEMAQTFARAHAKSEHKSLSGSGYFVPGLTFYGTYGTIQLMEKVATVPYDKQKRLGPSGFFSFPYSGAANHKRDNFMASVRGFSKYIWDFESGHKVENPFGRYTAFGALMLFTGENENGLLTLNHSGMNLDGYQWSYMPGATTKELPMDKVFYHVEAHPNYGEGKHRNFTEQTFLGALDTGDNGIYAMDLVDTVPADQDEAVFEKGFSAKKSYFFFDNEIICLGSGIQSSDERYNTITTLFQNLHDVAHPTKLTLNGKAVSYPSHSTDGALLGDVQGNYYIVPKDYQVKLMQGDQDTRVLLPRDKKKSGYQKRLTGAKTIAASKAWIDHGKAPQNSAYEYSILVKGSATQAQRLQDQPSYHVLRKDNDAHILKHHASASTAYVLFSAQNDLPGVVNSTNTPLIINVSKEAKQLNLSIADPDLRLAKWNHNMSYMPLDITNAPAQAHYATVRLQGQWELAEPHADISSIRLLGNVTTFTIKLDHGLSRQLKFKSIK